MACEIEARHRGSTQFCSSFVMQQGSGPHWQFGLRVVETRGTTCVSWQRRHLPAACPPVHSHTSARSLHRRGVAHPTAHTEARNHQQRSPRALICVRTPLLPPAALCASCALAPPVGHGAADAIGSRRHGCDS